MHTQTITSSAIRRLASFHVQTASASQRAIRKTIPIRSMAVKVPELKNPLTPESGVDEVSDTVAVTNMGTRYLASVYGDGRSDRNRQVMQEVQRSTYDD